MTSDLVDKQITVSVVVPVYSGSKYLHALFEEIQALRDRWVNEKAPMSLVEVIFVDDAAVDTSPEIIDQLSQQHSWVTAIHLARNFGQHPATIAGILHTSGDWIVTLDEDLQHPPAYIDELFREVAGSSYDVVYAKAESKVHENYTRDLGSSLYKRLIEKLSGIPNIRSFNSFRLIRGSVGRAAGSVCSHDTYFDVALSWFTQRVGIVPMRLKDHRFIQEGKSGYKLSKLLSHARRMLMSSGAKVSRIGGASGLLILGASLVFGLILLLRKIFFPETILVGGWTSLILAVVFFGGIITFLIGVALEYLSFLVTNAHGRPIFFIVDRKMDEVLVKYYAPEEP
ncbi:undecaprenyl-phosphate 4-deoxy-4-formamido-L-arabinose transferase [Microvirga lupini]|uniref:Undecaprenyl-phosphate 4-deoxy-4-formamido-L-arabinose transferase n=1 Tax=Microvirga lupini TaxID=420324 RepID=A0A7W4YWA1_9HYPH|nr:glycosyltransferase family 2 protein [Microvirga lupini]MBB3018711.1 undecaprenyl-phosphate 4-deoxy-4-formamido-L-arabinose transferase [Microvirga lupini]